MGPKPEMDSISKLRRRRGQFRFQAQESLATLTAAVVSEMALDASSWATWQIATLECELGDTRKCLEAYVEAHIDVQCAEDTPEDAQDKDSKIIQDVRAKLIVVARDIRSMKYRCSDLDVNVDRPKSSQTRIDVSLRPDPLSPEVTLPEFMVWRRKFEDFYGSNKLETYPLEQQRAHLRGSMEIGMIQTLAQYLDVGEDKPVKDVLDELHSHLVKSVNVVRRRHDFNILEID